MVLLSNTAWCHLNPRHKKIHYQRHYVNTVCKKGALPLSSIDRTEPLHKLLKDAWRRSNKGKDSIKFVLKEHTTLSAFQSHINSFDPGEVSENAKLEHLAPDDARILGFLWKVNIDVR